MAADEDLDETGKSKTPPTCYEPCSYSEYLYDVSDSNYPTRRYWDDYLSKIVSLAFGGGSFLSNSYFRSCFI